MQTEKEREAQRKYRLEQDPDSDYELLDDWLVGSYHG